MDFLQGSRVGSSSNGAARDEVTPVESNRGYPFPASNLCNGLATRHTGGGRRPAGSDVRLPVVETRRHAMKRTTRVTGPIENRYGLSIGFSHGDERHYFVESPIEKVAGLSGLRKRVGAPRWERDAHGQSFHRPATIFYQLRGHGWTGAEALAYNPKVCSRRLGCKVVVYGQLALDDFPLVYYALYDQGEAIEKFDHQEGRKPRSRFLSKVREAPPGAEDEDPFRFIDTTFKGLGLLAVKPPFENTGKHNTQGSLIFTLTDASLAREDFERVDLVTP
jgi:hypothetical protein